MYSDPKVFILFENKDWLPPLQQELTIAGIPYETKFVQTGKLDLSQVPENGIYFNRMSPSSHTRGHIESVDFMREILGWLESHDQNVINGSRAFALEVSKVLQYAQLNRFGIRTPHTIAVSGSGDTLIKAAESFKTPFITKHNRGGKGLGVRLFNSESDFADYVLSNEFEQPTDHITLLQEYIQSPEPYITRVEIVSGEMQYAIKSDTSKGFLLCPAEGCEPTSNETVDPQSIFSLREGFDDPIVDRYVDFMKANKIDIAGIEFIEDEAGNKITYDVNTTSNYSPAVEEAHGLNAWGAVVRMIQQRLNKIEQTKFVRV